MTTFAWALIGPGKIARRFADAVAEMPGTELRALLGRDATRAGDFAANGKISMARIPSSRKVATNC